MPEGLRAVIITKRRGRAGGGRQAARKLDDSRGRDQAELAERQSAAGRRKATGSARRSAADPGSVSYVKRQASLSFAGVGVSRSRGSRAPACREEGRREIVGAQRSRQYFSALIESSCRFRGSRQESSNASTRTKDADGLHYDEPRKGCGDCCPSAAITALPCTARGNPRRC